METYLKTYLTKRERDYLKMKARNSKLTESEYVRQKLAEASPRPFPKYNWAEVAEGIRNLGYEIDAIVALANSAGYIEVDGLRFCACEFDEIFSKVEAFANSLPPRPKTKPARIARMPWQNKSYFHVRCTQSEKNLVHLKADFSSMTVSAYIREVLLENPPDQKPPAAFFQLRYQLTSIINNLNQLAGFARHARHDYWIENTVRFLEDFRNRYHDFMQKFYN